MARHLGVILIFYDLPVKEAKERRNAAEFRKNLTRNGYIAIQKSVYCKLIRNKALYKQEVKALTSYTPESGSVSIIPMTIEEFRKMTTLCGEPFDMGLFADDIVRL